MDENRLTKDGKMLFEKQQSEGMVSEVEGKITRFQPDSGLTPSGEKIFKSLGAHLDKEPAEFNVTASHTPTEVKGEDFRPSAEKINKGMRLEKDEENPNKL